MAITVCEAIPDWKRWDIRILATDIDSEILGRASRGCYAADRIKGLSRTRLKRFFSEATKGGAPAFQVAPDIADLITFKQFNLMERLPIRGPLDAIFCRNVIIYFDKETQRELFSRVASLQRKDDLLFLGHSESLFNVSNAYSLIGKTVYRRSEP